MSDAWELMEKAIQQDRAVYAAAGLLPVRCEWCGDTFEPDDKRFRRNQFGFTFCSEYCRRAWRRAEAGGDRG